MKLICLFLLTLPFCAVYGQKAKKQTAPNKLSIGFNFSPDYSFRTLNNNDGGSSGNIVIKSRNEMEEAKFGYTTGLNISFNFSTFLEFETGIQYSDKGYKTKNHELFYAQPDPGQPQKGKFIYSYQYIGIPLKVKLTFGKSKVRFLSSAGLMTNFLLKARSVNILEYANGTTDKKSHSATAGFNKIDISPMISLGIDFKVNSKIRLIAEPTFRYGIIKTKDAPVQENLWNTGLNVGVYYRLK